MNFLLIKALHLIFVITWFAGLFYLVRLYVYHAEAYAERSKNQVRFEILHEQFSLMERRLLFGITWPSALLTLVLGSTLASQYWPISQSPWLMVKIFFLVLLYGYHLSCHYLYGAFKSGAFPYSGRHMRIWNEVPTLLLFAIVFLAVLRDGLQAMWAVGGLLLLSFSLLIAIRVYARLRHSS